MLRQKIFSFVKEFDFEQWSVVVWKQGEKILVELIGGHEKKKSQIIFGNAFPKYQSCYWKNGLEKKWQRWQNFMESLKPWMQVSEQLLRTTIPFHANFSSPSKHKAISYVIVGISLPRRLLAVGSMPPDGPNGRPTTAFGAAQSLTTKVSELSIHRS